MPSSGKSCAIAFRNCQKKSVPFLPCAKWMVCLAKRFVPILSISDSNLWVMLHRARMALRECLEMNWFDTPAGGTV